VISAKGKAATQLNFLTRCTAMCAQKDEAAVLSEVATNDGIESTTSEVLESTSTMSEIGSTFGPGQVACQVTYPLLPELPPGRPVAPAALQHVVWCSERCYKEDEKENLDLIEKETKKLGAQLTRIKKGDNKFKAWLDSMEVVAPYMILTNLREFKPVMQVLSQMEPWKQPVVCVVLTVASVEDWSMHCEVSVQAIKKLTQLPDIIDHLAVRMEDFRVHTMQRMEADAQQPFCAPSFYPCNEGGPPQSATGDTQVPIHEAQKDEAAVLSEVTTNDGIESTTSEVLESTSVMSEIGSSLSPGLVACPATYPPLPELPPGRPVTPAALQHVVWCSERCYQGDEQESLDIIEKESKKLRAELVRCRKGHSKFKAWLDSMEVVAPYMLLTNFREFKPCIQVLSQMEPWKQPVICVVLCEITSQFDRTVAFVEELSTHSNVWVQAIKKLAFLPDIIDHLAVRMEDLHMHTMHHMEAVAQQFFCVPSVYPCSEVPVEDESPSCVDEILSPIRDRRTKAEIMQLLQDAQPDRYDD